MFVKVKIHASRFAPSVMQYVSSGNDPVSRETRSTSLRLMTAGLLS